MPHASSPSTPASSTAVSDPVASKLSIERRTEDLLVSTRVEQLGETPAWTEGVGLRGTEVMLIAVADPSAAGVRSVVSALA